MKKKKDYNNIELPRWAILVIGMILVIFGLIRFFFLPATINFSTRVFQYSIENGGFSIILGIGFMIGFFLNKDSLTGKGHKKK